MTLVPSSINVPLSFWFCGFISERLLSSWLSSPSFLLQIEFPGIKATNYMLIMSKLYNCVFTYCLLITKQRLKGEKIKVNSIKLTWVRFTKHDIRFVYTLKNSQCCISLAIENSVLHLLLINEYINSMWSNFNE